MGIYDRDYYREDPPPGDGVWVGRTSAVKVLMGVNIAVFLVWFFAIVTGAKAFEWFLRQNLVASPEALANYRVWTLVTYAFAHSMEDLLHIFFNMWGLWFFGKMLEEDIGPRNLTFVYLASALMSAGLFFAINELTGHRAGLVGASGAVCGIAIAVALYHPNRVIRLFMMMPVQMKWVAIGFVIIDVVGAAAGRGNIAHTGHLGGALMGFLFHQFDLRPFDRAGRAGRAGRTGFLQRLRRLFRRKPKLRVVPRPERREESGVGRGGPDSATAARVDELLAKINREGLQSLSVEEKQFLEEASQKYRK